MSTFLEEVIKSYFDKTASTFVLADDSGEVVSFFGRDIGVDLGGNLFADFPKIFDGWGDIVEELKEGGVEKLIYDRAKNLYIFVRGGKVSGGYYLEIKDVTGEVLKEKMIRRTERLDAVVDALKGFIHEISHPLTLIIGYAQLGLSSGADGEVKESLEGILKGALRTKELIDSFSFFIRGEEEGEEVSVGKVVEECCADLESDISEGGISLIFENKAEGDDTVYANPFRLRELFLNLFKNSIYFLQKVNRDRVISIKLEKKGKDLVIIFEDNGPGIPEENIKKIFDPFFTTKKDSKGLGLSIVHKIVSEIGGKIDVVSRYGEYTRFIIFLPRYERKKRIEKVLELKNYSFLIYDKQGVYVDMIGNFLEKHGAQRLLRIYDIGDLAGHAKERYDLIIIGEDALDLFKGKKVIVLSESKDDPPFFLKKPFSLEKLKSAIERLLGDGEDSFSR